MIPLITKRNKEIDSTLLDAAIEIFTNINNHGLTESNLIELEKVSRNLSNKLPYQVTKFLPTIFCAFDKIEEILIPTTQGEKGFFRKTGLIYKSLANNKTTQSRFLLKDLFCSYELAVNQEGKFFRTNFKIETVNDPIFSAKEWLDLDKGIAFLNQLRNIEISDNVIEQTARFINLINHHENMEENIQGLSHFLKENGLDAFFILKELVDEYDNRRQFSDYFDDCISYDFHIENIEQSAKIRKEVEDDQELLDILISPSRIILYRNTFSYGECEEEIIEEYEIDESEIPKDIPFFYIPNDNLWIIENFMLQKLNDVFYKQEKSLTIFN